MLCPSTTNAAWFIEEPINLYTSRLDDIVNHATYNKVYYSKDSITYAHEYTHYVNSEYRQKYNTWWTNTNAFYVLDDTVCVVREPVFTLKDMALKIPTELRGDSYNLYLIQQTKYWNTQPLYIVDEWVCYTNGAMVGLELRQYDRFQQSLASSLEFMTYSLVLCQYHADYDLIQFIKWHGKRCHTLYLKAKDINLIQPKHEIWQKIINQESLRKFIVRHFGPKWYSEIFRIAP